MSCHLYIYISIESWSTHATCDDRFRRVCTLDAPRRCSFEHKEDGPLRLETPIRKDGVPEKLKDSRGHREKDTPEIA